MNHDVMQTGGPYGPSLAAEIAYRGEQLQRDYHRPARSAGRLAGWRSALVRSRRRGGSSTTPPLSAVSPAVRAAVPRVLLPRQESGTVRGAHC